VAATGGRALALDGADGSPSSCPRGISEPAQRSGASGSAVNVERQRELPEGRRLAPAALVHELALLEYADQRYADTRRALGRCPYPNIQISINAADLNRGWRTRSQPLCGVGRTVRSPGETEWLRGARGTIKSWADVEWRRGISKSCGA
jgi:hypothetical protein